jgi:hypothetical protein
MKTPREILLGRHRVAEPKLDAIREKAVAELASGAASASSRPISGPWPQRAVWVLWRELIFPCRHIWAGLAAAWMVLLLLNLPVGNRPARVLAETLPPDREVQALLREQREMFVQLVGAGGPSPAVPNKMTVPRSEVIQTITLV